jgi:methyl coenzyme M reductase subunit C
MPYIFSTKTSDTIYPVFEFGNNDVPKRKSSILIKGGAGIASKHLVTPLGVATSVTDAELEQLKGDRVFNIHLANGYLSIQNKEHSVEKVVPDMVSRDKSAPIVPEDYSDDDMVKPMLDKKGKR